ncbi:G5P family DNA-binding protein [Xanthomonas euvesicatoria]|uniref:G5P family DNA-binding protein n=1 Tax=Xanthomonas euvesicatoria TaxID=456327 RepID=UPI001C48A944|nr:G5P family DNA-binding protein [Xanthomonas euvesicatoria]MBV6778850.1 G5P family DNA-binding protein [Xanthomonas campestris pv. carissae]
MPICRILSAAVEEEVNQKTGEVMRGQIVGLDLGNGHALPFRVGLGKRPAYQPGEYDIDPKAFSIGNYGELTLKRYVDLVPLTPKAAHQPAKG